MVAGGRDWGAGWSIMGHGGPLWAISLIFPFPPLGTALAGGFAGVQDGNLSLARELLSHFRVTKHGSRKPLRVVSDPLSYEVRDRVSRRNKGPLSLSRYPRTLWRPGVLNFEGDSVCAGRQPVRA
jgi:hypothetical protein